MFYAKDNALLYAFDDSNQRDHEVSVQGLTPIYAKEAHKLYGKNPAVDCDSSNFVPEGGYHILSPGLRKPGVFYLMSVEVRGQKKAIETHYTKRLRDLTYYDVQTLLSQTLGPEFYHANKIADLTYEFVPGVIYDNIRFWEQNRIGTFIFIRINDSTRNR